MISLLLRRFLAGIPTLMGVVVLTFVLTRLLPGDAAAYFAGPAATPASIAEIRQRLGLDQSLPQQFVTYLRQLAGGDLGRSLTSGQSVLADLLARLPASLELTLLALMLAALIGIGLGMLAAMRPGGWADRIGNLIGTAGQAVPTFFLGLLLVYVFYYRLGWAPAPLGRLDILYSSPTTITGFWLVDTLIAGDVETFIGVARQLMLPVITLSSFGIGPIARMTRAGMIEALAGDPVRMACAAGLSRRKILWTYAFRTVVVPVLNTAGMVFSFMLGANVLVEKVFAWPGVGSFAVEALIASDFAPVQGFVLTMAILYVLLNLGIDLLNRAIDPRARRGA